MATEVALNVFLGLVSRAIDYSDSLLANRYTQHVSVRVMEQAARLDLTTYEDPVFYDRLERARVQATDRLAMIQQMGRLIQQVITTLTFSIALVMASPWLVLLLALGVLPSFVGETHYAFLGYAKNFRQTPAKRQMDYLRQVAGSRDGAKEVKLFGLSEFFTRRFEALAHQIYVEDIALSRSKLIVGGLLGILGTLGYYGAYVYVIWRTLHGAYDIGKFTFLTAAIQQASSNLQQVFSTASGIADQALFLTDLLAFFQMEPTIRSKPNGLPMPQPVRAGFEFRNVSFQYPGTERRAEELQPQSFSRRANRPDRRKWPGKDDGGEAHHSPLRPDRGANPARRRRLARVFNRRSPPPYRGDLSGLYAIRNDGARKHRGRACGPSPSTGRH